MTYGRTCDSVDSGSKADNSRGTASAGLLVTLAGLILMGSAVWFGASWISISTSTSDATCGSVFRPDIWLAAYGPRHCRIVMSIRAVVAAVFIAGALVLAYLAVRGRWRSTTVAALLLAGAAALSTVVLLVNEVVRDDGAL